MNRNKSRDGSWIPASLWKYMMKSSPSTIDESHRGDRRSELAFRSLNAEACDGMKLRRQGSERNSPWLEGLPFDPTAKECMMRRVDPDCVDSLFAEYDSESWTGTSSANVSGGPSQELELLSGVDAIIDFIQAAQNSFSETAPAEVAPSRKSSNAKSKR